MDTKTIRDFKKEQFINVPDDCNVVYLWAWNAPITKEKIDQQLEEFLQAGIKGLSVFPQPKDNRPESLRGFMDPDYLTEEYFELYIYLCEKARDLGIQIWIFDEGGCPSGGACMNTVRQNPEAEVKVLKCKEIILQAGESYTLPERSIAAFEEKVRLKEHFVAERDMVFKEYFLQFWGGDRESHVDCTNPGVTDTFLKNTYEAYKKHVGHLYDKNIPMMFTDESNVPYGLIPKGFYELFEERFGYDMRDYLYAIYDAQQAQTREECMARVHFVWLKGELLRHNFFVKIADWCRENDILFGGHLGGEDIADYSQRCGYYSILSALRTLDVPGVDEIWEQIRYPYGGRPPVHYDYKEEMAEGCLFYPRNASSAARQGGNLLALTESFAIHGDGITPDEMRYIINYQAVRGINTFSIMELSLGRSRHSAFVHRPVFSPEKPGFLQLAHLNTYFSRLAYVGRLGEAEGDTALYYPAGDYCANREYRYAAIDTYNEAGKRLEEKNIPFDLIDDWGIMAAEDTGDGLKLGSAVYRHIVVPECHFMPEEVREKIAPYLGEGAPIVCAKSPALRVMRRKLDEGHLYFVFNQEEGFVQEILPIEKKASEHIYLLDLMNGEMYAEQNFEINLGCGELAVFLVTEKEYVTVKKETEYSVEVQDFLPVSVKKMVINYYGLTCEYLPGDAHIDSDFSGEVTYRGRYELPGEPKAGERYRIVLEDTTVSARVSLDGEIVATLGCTPMTAMLPAEKLKKTGEIEVTVANTGANEIVAKQYILNDFPKAEIGPYVKKTNVFEKARPTFVKLGKVRIEKMAD